MRILAFSAFFGVYKAIWFGFGEILNFITEQVLDLSEECGLGQLLQSVGFLNQEIQSKLQMKVDFNMASQFREPLTDFELKFKNQAEKFCFDTMLAGLRTYMAESSELFSEPGIYVHLLQQAGGDKASLKSSLISKLPVKSLAYTLEDSKSVVTMEEALEWAIVNKFSPLR